MQKRKCEEVLIGDALSVMHPQWTRLSDWRERCVRDSLTGRVCKKVCKCVVNDDCGTL